eukprot:COSAG01_NODE_51594_length_353_cov_1.358268_1_plen_26_part_10
MDGAETLENGSYRRFYFIKIRAAVCD